MKLRIVITGSTGLIGSELVRYFTRQGHVVTRVLRRDPRAGLRTPFFIWNIDKKQIDAERLEGQDMVIHLAGANIAAAQWTPKYKEIILQSRVKGTSLLSDTLASLKNPPRVFFSASAIGYYGSHDAAEIIDESFPVGTGFLAQVCDLWEKSTQSARVSGIRTVHMRFGVVLSRRGGMLKKILPVFRLGLGGPVGSGRQPVSWIALAEIGPIIEFILQNENISGVVNFVAPETVSNREFSKILGGILNRPAFVPLPSFAAESMFGEEMAQTLLLSGARVVPRHLLDAGYRFRFPGLRAALAQAVRE